METAKGVCICSACGSQSHLEHFVNSGHAGRRPRKTSLRTTYAVAGSALPILPSTKSILRVFFSSLLRVPRKGYARQGGFSPLPGARVQAAPNWVERMVVMRMFAFLLLIVGCSVDVEMEDEFEPWTAVPQVVSTPAPGFTLCLDCFCADTSYAPIGTHCGVDGMGRCRSGRCSYRCGGYDNNCSIYSSWYWEAAAGCTDPCGSAMMCPPLAEPTEYCEPFQPQ